jgi:hypothetical protein
MPQNVNTLVGYFPGIEIRPFCFFLQAASPCYTINQFLRPEERRFLMTMMSEEIRLRYLYRRLVIDGKARLSFEAARRLVGPDCAYHLYAFMKKGEEKASPFPQDRRTKTKKQRA